jgi:hypothetical protein
LEWNGESRERNSIIQENAQLKRLEVIGRGIAEHFWK